MRVLGIDPGPTKSAAVLWNGSQILWMGDFSNHGARELMGVLAIDAIACEHLECFGMAVGKETFETGYWIGEFRALSALSGIQFHRVYRSQVKMCLCGNRKAKDGNIRQALIDSIGPQGKKKTPGPTYGVHDHLWSALAVAVTFTKRNESDNSTVADAEHGEGLPLLQDPA